MEERTLQDVLDQNRLASWRKEKAKMKKQQKKENILFIGIVILVAVITSLLIIKTNNDIDKCIDNHNANYCMKYEG